MWTCVHDDVYLTFEDKVPRGRGKLADCGASRESTAQMARKSLGGEAHKYTKNWNTPERNTDMSPREAEQERKQQEQVLME